METVLMLVFLSAEARPESVAEFKSLSGTWDVVSVVHDGKPADPDLFGSKVQFTDRKPDGIEKRCDMYTIAIDPKANPRRITATVAGGEIKGMKMLMIYQLDGDKLTLRAAFGAKESPVGFKAELGDGTTVYQLRRAKK